MPQSGGILNRPEVPKKFVENAIDSVCSKLNYRLTQKGSATYASKHEILGILAEEYQELTEVIRIDTCEGYNDFAKELLDIAVGATFGYACITAGFIKPSEWELLKEAAKKVVNPLAVPMY